MRHGIQGRLTAHWSRQQPAEKLEINLLPARAPVFMRADLRLPHLLVLHFSRGTRRRQISL